MTIEDKYATDVKQGGEKKRENKDNDNASVYASQPVRRSAGKAEKRKRLAVSLWRTVMMALGEEHDGISRRPDPTAFVEFTVAEI